MAMSVGDSGDDAPMSDINTTPLVDVMLVLLIIFLIAIPVVIQNIDLSLPKVQFEPTTTKPENVALSITGAGGQCQVYWGMTPVTSKELLDKGVEKLRTEIDRQGGPNAAGLELPEVHIRGDVSTPYRCIGGTIYTMQMAGFVKVGFISEPEAGSAVTRM
ncbi:ExbD/TolR family protein [Sphingomonas psychrotolerans]|uniref:Biopolymer transporter ExbD n=1 Tax=Sphingomonas psychrotolerans TaxID=1327635 RepID=A0A2K8MCV4_9SPHN|nr:biopolymer transporter ExbD [Sphingomonas psychrotolerans]ATY31722.1 biopolymer transporter ExbD [Sphingomonas psychrotolerans]